MDDALLGAGVHASPRVAVAVREHVERFLAPPLVWLDARLDVRLVRTFARGIAALAEWRNRAHGLLLSEPGG